MSGQTIHTGGGSAVHGSVSAGTFIGRDQIILLGNYTAEDLETVLVRLEDRMAIQMAGQNYTRRRTGRRRCDV